MKFFYFFAKMEGQLRFTIFGEYFENYHFISSYSKSTLLDHLFYLSGDIFTHYLCIPHPPQKMLTIIHIIVQSYKLRISLNK